MSVTVADCLRLQSLKDAKLVAGEKGLNRTVSTASVLEYPEVSLLSNELVIGSELLISALVLIKDDVQAQCRLLRHLHNSGSACLVLYYTGIFIKEIDESVIATANEIGFPLIIMPPNRFDFRYSELLTEVIETVMDDQKTQTNYVTEMANRISQLAPQHQTVKVIMQMLCDRIRCTLLLVDENMKRKAASTYPISNQWDYDAVLSILKEIRPLGDSDFVKTTILGREVTIWTKDVVSKNKKRFLLIALDENGNQTEQNISQAAELIGLFLNVWNKDVDFEGTHALIRAIMTDSPDEKERLAKSMRMDIERIHTIWILRPERADDLVIDSNQWAGCIQLLKEYLKEKHKLVVVDSYENYIIAMTDDNVFEEENVQSALSFSDMAREYGVILTGVVNEGVENTAEAREGYLLADNNISFATRVFSQRKIFTMSDMKFIQGCRNIISQGEAVVSEYITPLTKLLQLSSPDELLQTLCIYLLDSDRNMQQTGQMLHIHKNTVKYRIGKICNALKWDMSHIAETYDLFQACALYRLVYGE